MCQWSVLEVWNEDAFVILKYSATHCQNIKEILKRLREEIYCIYLFLLVAIRPSQLVLSMWFYCLGPIGFLPWECLAGLLFVSLSLFLLCLSVKPTRVLPPSIWLAHQFWMNGVCVPSHHQMMLQPKSSGECTPYVRTLGLPRGR